MKEYLLERFKEPSTWRAAVWVATSFGLALHPEQQEAIIAFGCALAGGIGFLPDRLLPPKRYANNGGKRRADSDD